MKSHSETPKGSGPVLLIHAAAQAAGRGESQVHPLNGTRQIVGGVLNFMVGLFRHPQPVASSTEANATPAASGYHGSSKAAAWRMTLARKAPEYGPQGSRVWRERLPSKGRATRSPGGGGAIPAPVIRTAGVATLNGGLHHG